MRSLRSRKPPMAARYWWFYERWKKTMMKVHASRCILADKDPKLPENAFMASLGLLHKFEPAQWRNILEQAEEEIGRNKHLVKEKENEMRRKEKEKESPVSGKRRRVSTRSSHGAKTDTEVVMTSAPEPQFVGKFH